MFKNMQVAAAAICLLLPTSVAAQNVPLDEGAFRLSVNDEIVGREEFSQDVDQAGRGARHPGIIRVPDLRVAPRRLPCGTGGHRL